MTILRDGKLKPGVYRIQNIVGQTYVDIQERTRELCCRSATALIGGKGLVGLCLHLTPVIIVKYLQWEILPSGRGYTIRRVQCRIAFPFNRGVLKVVRRNIARSRGRRTVLYLARWNK